MSAADQSRHGMWSGRMAFVLAAAGSAVGLGNIWKFPYLAGEYGGGAFVLVFIACIALIAGPIMVAEAMLGRAGRHSPINSLRTLVEASGAAKVWMLIGWMGALAGILILSYYAVIAGWALYYVGLSGFDVFREATPQLASDVFNVFLSQPLWVGLFGTIFIIATVWIVGRGIAAGLEASIRWFMPLLFLFLIVLLIYCALTADFGRAFSFMFRFDWSAMNAEGLLAAMGQAFFTLSIGMGAIMAYGAYMPPNIKLVPTIAMVTGMDLFVSLSAGLVVFSIVFANDMASSQGPGLMFISMPLAFGHMPMGWLFGALFFVLVSFAAITSTISLMEPAVAYLVETFNAKRTRVALSIGVLTWLLSGATVLSFNHWASFYVVGEMNPFAFIDYATQNIMLPLGGLMIALFAAYVLPKTMAHQQLQLSGFANLLWRVLIGAIAPLGVVVVAGVNLWRTAIAPLLGNAGG